MVGGERIELPTRLRQIRAITGDSRAGRGASVPLRQSRAMTADKAERKLNCIGWPCVTADCSELGPQPKTPSDWGFSFAGRGLRSHFLLERLRD
jgi:hypothetical protein